MESEKRKLATENLKTFTKLKEGNSAELNLFLIGLLKYAGFETDPVLISTRDHGKVYSKYPFHHFFNYVIGKVKINNQWLLIDATDPFCPNNMLPSYCINGSGLIIQKDKEEWIKLETKVPSVCTTHISHNFDESEKTDKVKVSFKATNYDALDWRKESNNKKENLLKKLEIKENQVTEFETKSYDSVEQPFLIKLEANVPTEHIDDKLFISPFLDIPVKENPLKQKARTYPVDMIYPVTRTYVAEIKIPKGYELEYLPENLDLKNSLFEITYISDKKENSIIISSSYSFKESRYNPEYYSRIKSYFNVLVKQLNDKVILTKSDSLINK